MNAVPNADEIVRRIQTLFGASMVQDDGSRIVGSPYAVPDAPESFDIDMPGVRVQPAEPQDAATTWLNTPNPTFGGLCPKLFVNGTDQQRAFLDTVLSSLEDGAFS